MNLNEGIYFLGIKSSSFKEYFFCKSIDMGSFCKEFYKVFVYDIDFYDDVDEDFFLVLL